MDLLRKREQDEKARPRRSHVPDPSGGALYRVPGIPRQRKRELRRPDLKRNLFVQPSRRRFRATPPSSCRSHRNSHDVVPRSSGEALVPLLRAASGLSDLQFLAW